MRPEVGEISRLIMRRLVVLPQPDGPTSTVICPDGATKSSSSTAVVGPYFLVTCSNRIIGLPPHRRSCTWMPAVLRTDLTPGALLSAVRPGTGAVIARVGRRLDR